MSCRSDYAAELRSIEQGASVTRGDAADEPGRYHWRLEDERLEKQAVAIFVAVKQSLEESGDYLDMLAAIRKVLSEQ